ncbi:site-2 protease family protein [Salinibaculum rarum]|uniref:site-2 protease family protein n=1 Tax=Salinibaculum rarum TaxID=3058903 RepID=UPI00265D7E12|nr:site-2 protease family protein [Salinibaculum sp. KK48]
MVPSGPDNFNTPEKNASNQSHLHERILEHLPRSLSVENTETIDAPSSPTSATRYIFTTTDASAPDAHIEKVRELFNRHSHQITTTETRLYVDVYASSDAPREPHSTKVNKNTTKTVPNPGVTTDSDDAEPQSLRAKYPITNIVMFGLTVVTTLFAGLRWYGTAGLSFEGVITVLPFMLSVLGVLGTHELGHYVVSQYYGVDASLPYFIPMPNLLGTLGAVIRMESEEIPSRKILFDIGIAGPLAGLIATVFVTVIGLTLPPVTPPPSLEVHLNYPPFVQTIAWMLGEQTSYVGAKTPNPVLVGAWAGTFITFLNLLPVGQLDGGHMMRAIIGPAQHKVQFAVPLTLVSLGGVVTFVLNSPGIVWFVWGVLTLVMLTGGTVDPADETPLNQSRRILAVVTFGIGALCFVPVPVSLLS